MPAPPSKHLAVAATIAFCAIFIGAIVAVALVAARRARVSSLSQERTIAVSTTAPAAVSQPSIAIPVRPIAPHAPQSPQRREEQPTTLEVVPTEAPVPRPPVVSTPSTAPEKVAPVPIGPPPVYSRAALQPVAPTDSELEDQQIGEAIRKGVHFLLSGRPPQVPPDHSIRQMLLQMPGFGAGEDALALYALLQSGMAINDPHLNPQDPTIDLALNRLKSVNFGHFQTYGRCLRATTLAVYNRPQDREALRADVAWLVRAGLASGTYTYEAPKDRNVYDNSNSQYGLLGVWSGAETGLEIPGGYWAAVQRHWEFTQDSHGQWHYGNLSIESPTSSMTCAGIASLLVTHDYLDPPKFTGPVGRDPYSPALRKGLNWLESADNSVDLVPQDANPYRDWGYNLYGVERVGLASGYKYFGSHDWYRELAHEILTLQLPDGSWIPAPRVETPYMLLFLSRGRHPILMNKLRFNGFWANRPHDASNLARFASHEIERPLNWQVVPLEHDWVDWTDSPILYLASHKPVYSLDDADVKKIRQFVLAGGMLFTQADGDSPEFDRFAHDLAHKLFPEYEMADVPPSHPIYSVMEPVKPIVPLKMVSNGVRILMLHSPQDISKYWERRDTKTAGRFFSLGLNLFVYAAGKQDFRNRLDSTYVAPVSAAPVQHVKIARLKYANEWDPEPYAWTRFASVFQRHTGYALEVTPTSIADLRPETFPIAHLTGVYDYAFSDADIAALRRYVASGGVLLIDPCGGPGAFERSFRDTLLPKAFPGVTPQILAPTHPLLAASSSGMQDLSKPRFRRCAIETLGAHPGSMMSIRFGRGHVIFSSLDLTSGLLGTNTWSILGFSPDYSQAFVQNLILWTLDGQKD